MQNMILICKLCNSQKKGLTLRVFCKKFGYDFDKICDRLENEGKDGRTSIIWKNMNLTKCEYVVYVIIVYPKIVKTKNVFVV